MDHKIIKLAENIFSMADSVYGDLMYICDRDYRLLLKFFKKNNKRLKKEGRSKGYAYIYKDEIFINVLRVKPFRSLYAKIRSPQFDSIRSEFA